MDFECTKITAFFSSVSLSTVIVSTTQCCSSDIKCANYSLLEYKSNTIPTKANITTCNPFTKKTSSCSYLTSKTSKTHIALSETSSSCLPIVSCQTLSANSPNVFEATYPIFVVAILLLLGTNIAFCIALWIKRNQLKKVLQGELKKILKSTKTSNNYIHF